MLWPKNSPESDGSVQGPGQVQNVLFHLLSMSSEDALEAETTKGSVQQKLNTLRQLAAEILAIVAEEEIEGEIERADLLEENVQLVIANIENALSPKVVCSNVKNGAYVSEST